MASRLLLGGLRAAAGLPAGRWPRRRPSAVSDSPASARGHPCDRRRLFAARAALSTDSLGAAAATPAPAPSVFGWGPAAMATRPLAGPQRIIFLGTPEFAAGVLSDLLDASAASVSLHGLGSAAAFAVVAVVSQPEWRRGRNAKRGEPGPPSPVAELAAARGIPPDRILTPATARDASFLATVQSLRPDLCVTAAYGNILPAAFLATPRCGTLNLHPSLLPRYRGAAPVQRQLEAGESVIGVSLAFTALSCDTGPVFSSEAIPTPPGATTPDVLTALFHLGSALLLRALPTVLAGGGPVGAHPQDDSKVRAFAGFAAVRVPLLLTPGGDAAPTTLELQLLETRVRARPPGAPPPTDDVILVGDALVMACDDGDLEAVRVQVAGKRPLAARDYANGLRGARLAKAPPAARDGQPAAA